MRETLRQYWSHARTTSRTRTPRRVWLAIALAFIFLEGVTGQLLGPLLPVLREEFGVSAALAGTVGTVNTVSFVVAVVVTGASLGFIRAKRTLLLGVVGVVLALAAMVTTPLFLVFLGAVGVRALGVGVFRGVDKPVLGHLFPQRRDRLLNLYELTWAFGAAAAPLVAIVATSYATWEFAYVGVLLLTVPLVGLALLTPLPVDDIDEQPLSMRGVRELTGNYRIRAMTLALLLSGGIEGGMFLWLPTYLQEFVGPTTANLAFSVYFITYIPARILHTVYAPTVGYLRLLVGSGVGAAVLLTYGFSVGQGTSVVVALALAGFFVAGLFPLLSAYGIEAVPENSGPINGLSLGASYLGGSLTPVVVGVIIDQSSIQTGMQLFTVYVIALALVLVTLLWYERGATQP